MKIKIYRDRATLGLGALAVAGVWAMLAPTTTKSAVDWFADICTTVGAPMFSSGPTTEGAAAGPRTTPQVLSCEPLPHVPGKSLTTMIVDFPPMAYTPAHRHPGSVTAVVVQGTIRSQMEGGPPVDYKTGQTWFEPPRALHMFAENPDPAVPARIVATFVTDDNCGPLVLPP